MTLGGKDEQALASVGRAVAAELSSLVDPSDRRGFEAVLLECFADRQRPGRSDTPGGRPATVLKTLAESVAARLAPLADAEVTGQGVSYLETVGVDAGVLEARAVAAVVGAIQAEATSGAGEALGWLAAS